MRHLDEKRRKSVQNRVADGITAFAGSMTFVYVHVIWFGVWIGLALEKYPFGLLTMIVSLEAIFLSTFILMTQNRMMSQADQRADLNLQISLLAEHEITRLLTLTKEISEKLGIRNRDESDLKELEHDVAPEQMLEVIEEHEKEFEK